MTSGRGGTKLRTVLCVVPDDDTFELLRVELISRGFATQHVSSVTAAREAARTGNYDIYIIDNWWMKDGSGLDLCRELRCDDEATPIIFYSGNVFPSEIAKALDAGAQAYIQLPDVSDELPGKVEQLVEAAERANRAAVQEETRSIREHLAERVENPEDRKPSTRASFDEALQNSLRAHALADFVRAGGKQARFDGLWPGALRKAVGSTSTPAHMTEPSPGTRIARKPRQA